MKIILFLILILNSIGIGYLYNNQRKQLIREKCHNELITELNIWRILKFIELDRDTLGLTKGYYETVKRDRIEYCTKMYEENVE